MWFCMVTKKIYLQKCSFVKLRYIAAIYFYFGKYIFFNLKLDVYCDLFVIIDVYIFCKTTP